MSKQDMKPGQWRTLLEGDDALVLANYRRPRAVVWSLQKPALVVIDVVETFIGPNADVLVAQRESRTACGRFAWQAIPNIVRLIEAFRSLGLPIIFTMADSLQSFTGGATRGADREDKKIVTGPIELITPRPGEVLLPKTRASIFFATPLVTILFKQNIQTLILTGGTTSGCVRASAVDGTSYGFDVLVAEDACFDRIQLLHDVALLAIDTKYGRVVLADQVTNTLEVT